MFKRIGFWIASKIIKKILGNYHDRAVEWGKEVSAKAKLRIADWEYIEKHMMPNLVLFYHSVSFYSNNISQFV